MVHTPEKRAGLATIPDVVEFLRISRAKLYQMMDRGELCYVKIGRSRRLRWEDVDRLVAASLVDGAR